jgi:hypothetical protein
MREKASNAGEAIPVTAKQLEKIFKKSGMKSSDIKMQLKVAKIMDGPVLVGDKLFELKEEKKD